VKGHGLGGDCTEVVESRGVFRQAADGSGITVNNAAARLLLDTAISISVDFKGL
jgi:hypothetical protein